MDWVDIYYVIADYSGCQPVYVKHVDMLENIVTWTDDIFQALSYPSAYYANEFLAKEVRKCGYTCCRVLEVYDDGE